MTRVRHDLAVTGMSCAGCVSSVERELTTAPGVDRALVNLATGKATVILDPEATTLAQLGEAVRRAGYGLILPEPGVEDSEERARRAERVAARNQLVVATIFGVPVLALGMTHGALGLPGELWIQLALTSVVMVFAGAGIWRRHRKPMTDVQVAAGVGQHRQRVMFWFGVVDYRAIQLVRFPFLLPFWFEDLRIKGNVLLRFASYRWLLIRFCFRHSFLICRNV